jgi:hypothetical protein
MRKLGIVVPLLPPLLPALIPDISGNPEMTAAKMRGCPATFSDLKRITSIKTTYLFEAKTVDVFLALYFELSKKAGGKSHSKLADGCHENNLIVIGLIALSLSWLWQCDGAKQGIQS